MHPSIPLAVSALSLLSVLFLIIDRIKKKNPDLIDRAVKMVELAERQSAESRKDLLVAEVKIGELTDTIDILNHQLKEANTRVEAMNQELLEARSEVISLRTQIRLMTQSVEEGRRNDREKRNRD